MSAKKAASSYSVEKRFSDLMEHIENQSVMLKGLVLEMAVEVSLDPSVPMARSSSNPTREELKPQVLVVIDAEAARNGAPSSKRARLRAGDERLKLEDDLNINKARRQALAIDYSSISTSYSSGSSVGPSESGRAETVAKAINLVKKRSSNNS